MASGTWRKDRINCINNDVTQHLENSIKTLLKNFKESYMCATCLKREIRKDCAGAQAPETDQIRHTHVILPQPCLTFQGRWSGKQESCWEGYDLIKPRLTNLFIPGCIRENYYIDTFCFSFIMFCFVFFNLLLPLYSWYPLRKERSVVLCNKTSLS